MSIGQTIADQIGRKALFMLGAKNLIATENGLTFRVGRNSKAVNVVTITLSSMDLYDVEFSYVRAGKKHVKSTVEGIYFDMLHAALREGTGMETSLPRFV